MVNGGQIVIGINERRTGTHQLTGKHAFEIAALQNLYYYFFREDGECGGPAGLLDWLARNSRGRHWWRVERHDGVGEGIERSHRYMFVIRIRWRAER